MLRIDERLSDGVMVLDLRGTVQVGGTDAMLRDKLNSVVQQGYRKLLVNMRRVTLVDSAGLGVFVMARGTVASVHGHIALMNVTNRFSRLLVVAGLVSRFEVFQTEASALRWFSTMDTSQPEVFARPAMRSPSVTGDATQHMQAR